MSSSFHKWLEPKILSGIAAASLALWVFVEVAENVIEGDARYFDTVILIALHSPDFSKTDWFSDSFVWLSKK